MIKPDIRKARLTAIIHGLTSALAARIISLIVGFVSVPLTVGYLGTERYGAWIAISSTIAWLQLADLGLGNGLTNEVSRSLSFGQTENARTQISTSLVLLTAISVVFASLSFLLWPHLDLNKIFGVTSQLARSETSKAAATALTISLFQFPLGITNKLYLSLQQGKLSNYWGMVGSILGLLALLVITKLRLGLVALVYGLSGTSLLISGVSTIWLFRKNPNLCPSFSLFNISKTKQLRELSCQFLLLQLMAVVVFQTDSLVIAHYLGAGQVAAYNIAYKLFSYTYLIQATVFSYLWSGYTDAYARHDVDWIILTFRKNIAASMASTGLLTATLIFVARSLVKVWAGPELMPQRDLCLWLAAWSIINSFTSPVACLFAALSHVKMQIYYAVLSTTANVYLTLHLIKRWGPSGTIAGTVISYIFFTCGPMIVDLNVLLRRLKSSKSNLVRAAA